MDLENTGKNWREEAPLLAAMEVKNPFTLPEIYFNDLKMQIHSLKIIEDARFKNEDEFYVPVNYFDNLTAEIESRVLEQDLKKIVVTPGFAVPERYFTNLRQAINSQTESADHSARAIVNPKRNWIKYAAAASVTLILGSVLVFNNQNTSIESQLDKVSDQELVNYLQMNSDMSDTPMIIENLSLNSNQILGNNFSDAQLEEYINTTI